MPLMSSTCQVYKHRGNSTWPLLAHEISCNIHDLTIEMCQEMSIEKESTGVLGKNKELFETG